MSKIFFYLFITFSVLHGSITSSHAMMNMTGEVWDYDNVTHFATYSCPRPCPPCNECETDVFATYGYPAILTAGGWIGAWAYTKGADYFWERTPDCIRNVVLPRVRNAGNWCANNGRNLINGIGERWGVMQGRLGDIWEGLRDRIFPNPPIPANPPANQNPQ